MKRSIIIGGVCLIIGFLLSSCHVPYDRRMRVVIEGTLTMDANPCMHLICEPGMGLWIKTTNDKFVIKDYWYNAPHSIVVGDTIAFVGDCIRAYGTTYSYREANGHPFREIALDSIQVLVSRGEQVDSIEGEIIGKMYIENDGSVHINGVKVRNNCYSIDPLTDCITIVDKLFCEQQDIWYGSVKAIGVIYTITDVYFQVREEMDVKQIQKL